MPALPSTPITRLNTAGSRRRGRGPERLYSNGELRSLYAALLASLSDRGVVLVTGPKEIGKTALLTKVREELEATGWIVISGYKPGLLIRDLLSSIACALACEESERSAGELSPADVQTAIAQAAANCRRIALLIDDADRLGGEVLLQLSSLLLSPTGGAGELRVVLSGGGELLRRLNLPVLAELRARVVGEFVVPSLGDEDIAALVCSRAAQGYWGGCTFCDEAVNAVAAHANGRPGRALRLCAASVGLARSRARLVVTADLVEESAEAVLNDQPTPPDQFGAVAPVAADSRAGTLPLACIGGTLAALVVAGGWWIATEAARGVASDRLAVADRAVAADEPVAQTRGGATTPAPDAPATPSDDAAERSGVGEISSAVGEDARVGPDQGDSASARDFGAERPAPLTPLKTAPHASDAPPDPEPSEEPLLSAARPVEAKEDLDPSSPASPSGSSSAPAELAAAKTDSGPEGRPTVAPFAGSSEVAQPPGFSDTAEPKRHVPDESRSQLRSSVPPSESSPPPAELVDAETGAGFEERPTEAPSTEPGAVAHRPDLLEIQAPKLDAPDEDRSQLRPPASPGGSSSPSAELVAADTATGFEERPTVAPPADPSEVAHPTGLLDGEAAKRDAPDEGGSQLRSPASPSGTSSPPAGLVAADEATGFEERPTVAPPEDPSAVARQPGPLDAVEAKLDAPDENGSRLRLSPVEPLAPPDMRPEAGDEIDLSRVPALPDASEALPSSDTATRETGGAGSEARAVPAADERAPRDRSDTVPLSSDIIDALVKRGREMLKINDISAARRLLERAAAAGSPAAALAAGETYDPLFLNDPATRRFAARPERAVAFYRQALLLGEQAARARIADLDAFTSAAGNTARPPSARSER